MPNMALRRLRRVRFYYRIHTMKKLMACFLLITMTGCATQTVRRGFIFPDDLEEQLAKFKTKRELEREFGSPQARTMFGDNVWIYYGANEIHRGPFPIIYEDRIALLVWSNPAGRITGTRVLRDDELPRMSIDPNETPIPAAIELNALEELVNNIGRFSPAGLGM